MFLDKNKNFGKSWTVLYVAYTILKAMEQGPTEGSELTEQLIESTMIELSKSVLILNNGRWD